MWVTARNNWRTSPPYFSRTSLNTARHSPSAIACEYSASNVAQGAQVFEGQLGATATLPAGRYTVEIRGASPLTITDIAVGGATTAVELREADGVLTGAVVANATP